MKPVKQAFDRKRSEEADRKAAETAAMFKPASSAKR